MVVVNKENSINILLIGIYKKISFERFVMLAIANALWVAYSTALAYNSFEMLHNYRPKIVENLYDLKLNWSKNQFIICDRSLP